MPPDLRQMVESLGPANFTRRMLEIVRDPDPKQSLRLEEVSIRGLWEAVVGPTGRTLTFGQRRPGVVPTGRTIEEELQIAEAGGSAIGTSIFKIITSELIGKTVMEAYDAPGYIGDQLVSVYQSKMQSERIPGFTFAEGPKEVAEGQEYEESGIAEKYVTTKTAKKGRLISITEEMVYFDQTGKVIDRANLIGAATRTEKEKIIVRGVIDADSGSAIYVYRPLGTGEILYSATNKNYMSGGKALENWTDIQEVLAWHAVNVTDDRAGTGEPIAWIPKILLTPVALAGVAQRMVSATVIHSSEGTKQLTIAPNLASVGTLLPLSSPFVDAVNVYEWFLGDFKKQFIWVEIWPLQVLRAAPGNEAEFTRDVVVRIKVRYYGGLTCRDEKFVIKIHAAA